MKVNEEGLRNSCYVGQAFMTISTYKSKSKCDWEIPLVMVKFTGKEMMPFNAVNKDELVKILNKQPPHTQ